MRKVKWAIWGILVLLVAGLLNYTMPQHDVVRITEAYNRQTSVSWANKYFYASPDAGTAESKDTRDIRFINAVFPDGSVKVPISNTTALTCRRWRPTSSRPIRRRNG
jgi:hypothetical protein